LGLVEGLLHDFLSSLDRQFLARGLAVWSVLAVQFDALSGVELRQPAPVLDWALALALMMIALKREKGGGEHLFVVLS